jgi:hypothetical protein
MRAVTRWLGQIGLVLASVVCIDAALAQTTEPAPPLRGTLLQNPPQKLGSYAPSDLISSVTDGYISQWVLEHAFSPNCSVDVYQLKYQTVGGQGEPTTASGALMIPVGSDGACTGPRPVALYAHGKRNLRSFNMADLGGHNYEGLIVALALAGDGFIVIAPNYAGYDSSTLAYHPFMNADQQAADMMDALAAGRVALLSTGASDNGKLFVTGYSEGGYVAMATHRALQAAGIPVTASAPMSGPYALTAFADAMFLGQVGAGAVEEFMMLVSSYQHAYGNLYVEPTDLFEPRYALADSFLPGAAGTDTLVAQGLIPGSAVFSSTPPMPELAAMTPADGPGFGPDNLVNNAYRLAYIQDARANPDGGYPDTTSGLPPANTTNALRAALVRNDLRNWTPASPTLLCAGDEDPVVFYLNTQLMEGYWAVNAPLSPVTILDVDAPSSHGGPYKHIKKQFAQTKKLLRWLEGRSEVARNYHDVLVPAFCLQAARSFFEGF